MTSQPGTPARQHHVRANGVDLLVTEYDSAARDAPPLVLLHGIGSRGVSWWPVVDRLAERFRLYSLDLRGHGDSAKPEAGYLLPDYAADLAALLDALNLDRPRILAHSLGGMVALTWAVDHPERAAAIALEDSALRSGRWSWPAFDEWLALNAMSPVGAAAAYASRYPEWSREDCERRARSITATARGVFLELRATAEVEDGTDRIAPLAAIQSPVLLVHGDLAAGGMVVPDDAARLAATLPHARTERIPGGGHNLHRDHSAAFLALVMPFLTDPEQAV